MKFSQKNKFILLGLLVVINIAIRLPVTAHAIGVDTFYIFSLAESISTFGSAKWILNPTSFFGVYPFSYPSAFMFILSGLSQTTSISMDYIILLTGMILGISGVFFMLLLAKEVWNNDMYAFLAAFSYSLSFNLLRYTLWGASTRGIFIAIFPLFLWILLKYRKSIKILLFLGLIIFILLAASHRVSFLLPIVIITFCAVILLRWLSKKVKISSFINPAVLHVHIFYILAIISIILFSIQFLNVGPFNVRGYYTGLYFTGDDFFSTFSNMAIDFTSKLGLIFVFIIPGFIILAGKSIKKLAEMFIILSVIVFLPLTGLQIYSTVIIAPFLILVSTFGFLILCDFFLKKKILVHVAFTLIILSSLFFILFMVSHSNVYEETMPENTYNSAQFIKYNSNGTLMANSGDLASKMTAYSTKPTLPLGGPYAIAQTPGRIIYGFATNEDLLTRPLTLSELNPSVDEFWVAYNAYNEKIDWETIIFKNHWDDIVSKNMFSKYKVNLIIESGQSGKYFYWGEIDSRLLTSLYESGNKIYVNGMENIYSVRY